MNAKRLIREQLEVSLRRFSALKDATAPLKGWIKAIRQSLGMTAKQLASRLGITQQAVTRIERDEPSGVVTIETMRRIAAGLDCEFVYGFIPRSSLKTTLRERAELVAGRRLARASQTMALEAQGLSAKENERVLSELVDELMEKLPPDLWNET